MRKLLAAAAAALLSFPALGQQKIDFILNWVPGGDHAPYYYAKKLGWYQKEGIDLQLEPGKSSGIKGIRDFPGKKIGNPAADGARTMWPALAKANGIDPKSVTWVNIDANSKLSALKSKAIDVTTSFYNIHNVFQKE